MLHGATLRNTDAFLQVGAVVPGFGSYLESMGETFCFVSMAKSA